MAREVLPNSLDKQDKTAVETYKPGKPAFSPILPLSIGSTGREYNLDYDEDVDALNRDRENYPRLEASSVRLLNKLLESTNNGNADSANAYEAILDALSKEDPIGLRKSFRADFERYLTSIAKSKVMPDFGHEAIAGDDEVSKEYQYEELKNRYKRWNPD